MHKNYKICIFIKFLFSRESDLRTNITMRLVGCEINLTQKRFLFSMVYSIIKVVSYDFVSKLVKFEYFDKKDLLVILQ